MMIQASTAQGCACNNNDDDDNDDDAGIFIHVADTLTKYSEPIAPEHHADIGIYAVWRKAHRPMLSSLGPFKEPTWKAGESRYTWLPTG